MGVLVSVSSLGLVDLSCGETFIEGGRKVIDRGLSGMSDLTSMPSRELGKFPLSEPLTDLKRKGVRVSTWPVSDTVLLLSALDSIDSPFSGLDLTLLSWTSCKLVGTSCIGASPSEGR
jgi:hypothetical protein